MIGESNRLSRHIRSLMLAGLLLGLAGPLVAQVAPASAPATQAGNASVAAQIEAVLGERGTLSPTDLIKQLKQLLQKDLSGVMASTQVHAYNAVAAANERLAQDARAAKDPGAERRAQAFIDAAVQALVQAGNAAIAGKDYPSANQALVHALELRPEHAEALLGLARVHGGTGHHLQAIEAYQDYIKATKRTSFEASLYVEIGRAYMGASLWNQAIRAFDDAIHAGRLTDDIAASLSQCYLGRGAQDDAVRAEESIRTAIDLQKAQPLYYERYAELLLAKQDLPKAAELATTGVAIARERCKKSPDKREEVQVLDESLSTLIKILTRVAASNTSDASKIVALSQAMAEQAEARRLLGIHDALIIVRSAPLALRDDPQILERLVVLEKEVQHPELRQNCERLLRVAPGNKTAQAILAELDKPRSDATTRPGS